MAATGKILGTVTSVVGEAKATAADGTVRILQVGDTVRSDETITTSAAGGVNIALENGKTLDCGANTDLSLHESILGVSTAAVTSKPAAPGSVEALQQAIASGQDPSQIAPATAAGGAPAAGGAGGDGSGGSPVIIEQANTAGVVESGFPTAGGAITFPTPEFELQNPEEEPPAVSVSVQVQVQVEVEVEVDVSIETGVEVLNGPAEGGVFAVSAGGDAVSLIEGTAEGTITIPFVITLDKVFDTDVQVTYQIVPDSASTPSDFFDGPLTNTITIPAGETSFVVPIQIVRDHFVEGNESFHIVLIDAENATINPDKDSASVTIFNDDAPPAAHDDTNWTQEDVAVVATGNVVNNVAHPGDPSATLSFADAADTDNFETPFVTNPGTYAGAHGTLVLNANGTYTYTLNNASAAVQALDSGETLTEAFGYTITDGFNAPDSATLTVTVFGSNDVPEITVKTSGDIFASGAQGTVDEAALNPNGSNPGSNAEFVTGSFKVADTDGIEDIQTVTINGQTVAVGNLVGAVFHGSAGDMTVTAYADGVASFTYQLLHAVTHNEANQTPPDVFTLTASDGTSNSAPANVTINILDDVPSTQVTASQATSELRVDETVLATNATANFAGDFAGGSSFGADGPGTVSDATYTLSIGGSDSGLVDSLTGNPVTLAMNGAVVEGLVDNGDGFSVVFTVSVDGDGNVTLDQQRSVMHTPDDGPDQPTSLAPGLVVLNRSATITDADGDTANASASINIGEALVFEDDAPSLDVTATVAADTLTVDDTTLGTNASASFADNFGATSGFGADGAGNLTTSYSVSASAGANSGIVDVATGHSVFLFNESGVVVGREGTSALDAADNAIVFTVSVDTGSGLVTLDQQRAVQHNDSSDPVESGVSAATLSAANLISVTRSSTITDADGDSVTDTATIDIGQSLKFEDDGPAVTVGDTFAHNADESSNTGAQSFNFGSDGQATSGALVLTSTGGLPEGFTLVQTAANTWKAVLGGVSDADTDLFVIVMNPADSTYTFTVLNGEPPVPVEIDIDSGLADGTWFDVNGDPTTSSSEVYTAVIEPSGDNPFRITASGVNEDGAAEIAVGNNTIGVGGDDVLQDQDDDVFILSLQNTTGEQVSFTSVVMTLQHFNENQEDFAITVTGFAPDGVTPKTMIFNVGDPGVSRVDGSEADSDVFTIDVEGEFGSVTQISTEGTDGVLKVIDFDLNFTVDRNVGDQAYDFLATSKDGDADTASDAFTVTVLAGTSGSDNLVTGADNDTVSGGEGNDTINAGAGNDILTGGAGNDVLTGGTGNDTYKYNAANEGADTINGFTVGDPSSNANADVLDISELLAGAGISEATFLASPAAYLQVTPGGNTTISFDSDGGGAGSSVLLVTLQGVNVTLATLLTNNEIKSS